MKPIIIYVENEENKNITISREQLEKFIQDAYQQGKSDGGLYIPYTPNNPYISPYSPIVTWNTSTETIKTKNN